MSQGRAKGILVVFIITIVAMLTASLFSAYPEEMLEDPIMKIATNSIFLFGGLANLIWLWLNPHILVANKQVIENYNKTGSGSRFLPLCYTSSLLMFAGVVIASIS
ncbi:hypothetical protein BMS3Bbin11_00022 [bacterium BMS3Bbin11]|nr:hypothetical protein BMS3Bbin11_00022 [bacterium BMS3Bbin11]